MEWRHSPVEDMEPPMFEALQESNVESTAVGDTNRFELGGICQFFPPKEPLHDETEDLAKQTNSTITTETDIDITASLLPSGGIRSHHHAIKTAVSETGLPEAHGYESYFHNEFSNTHPKLDECDLHSVQLGQRSNFHQRCLNRRSFATSTMPFSFGTNLKPGSLHPAPPKCIAQLNLQRDEMPESREVGKSLQRPPPSLFFQSEKEPLKHPGVKKIEDEDIFESEDLDSGFPFRSSDVIVPMVCSNSEMDQISLSEIYGNHISVSKDQFSDTPKTANVEIASQGDVRLDMVVNGTEEKLHCVVQTTQIVELGKHSRNENELPVPSKPEELQEYSKTAPISDSLKNPNVGSFGMKCGSQSSTAASKTCREEPEVKENITGERKRVPVEQESKREAVPCAKPSAAAAGQFWDWPAQEAEVETLNNLGKYSPVHKFEDDPEERMTAASAQNVLHKKLSIESTELVAEKDYDQRSIQESASNQGEVSLKDPFDSSLGANGSIGKTGQTAEESVKGNHILRPRVLNAGLQDADNSREQTSAMIQRGPLTPNIPEQEPPIWVKDTDPTSRPRNADTLSIAIGPDRLHDESVACVSAEPPSHRNLEVNDLAQLVSEILTNTSVEDTYGRIIKEHGDLFLEALRKTFLEATGPHFTLVDSGLILSSCREVIDPRKAFVTLWNGAKLVITTPRSSLFQYYRLGTHFYITENLSENWYRVKDRVTKESMLMKKVPVISNWKKLLHNFLLIPRHPFQLVPYAVVYDRNDSILYLMEDRNVLAVGMSPVGYHPDRGKLLSEVLNYLAYCKRNNVCPEDVGNNVIYTAQRDQLKNVHLDEIMASVDRAAFSVQEGAKSDVYFDPSGLTNNEDPCVFKKTFKHILLLHPLEPEEHHPAVESLVDSVCELLEEHTERINPISITRHFCQGTSRPGAANV